MAKKEDVKASDLFNLVETINALEPGDKELTVNFIKEIKEKRSKLSLMISPH